MNITRSDVFSFNGDQSPATLWGVNSSSPAGQTNQNSNTTFKPII